MAEASKGLQSKASVDCSVCGQFFGKGEYIAHVEACYNKLQLTLLKANLEPSLVCRSACVSRSVKCMY